MAWAEELQDAEHAVGPTTRMPTHGIADLRNPSVGRLAGSAFDELSYTLDVRFPEGRTGWYDIPRLGVFLWRLTRYAVTGVTPVRFSACTSKYTFDPTGRLIPLFAASDPARPYGDAWVSPTEQQLPGPISRLLFLSSLPSDGLASGDSAFADLYAANDPVTQTTTPNSLGLYNWTVSNPATTIASGSNTQVLPAATINVTSTSGFPSSGTFTVSGTTGTNLLHGDQRQQLHGVSGGSGTLTTGQTVTCTVSGSSKLTLTLIQATNPTTTIASGSTLPDAPGGERDHPRGEHVGLSVERDLHGQRHDGHDLLHGAQRQQPHGVQRRLGDARRRADRDAEPGRHPEPERHDRVLLHRPGAGGALPRERCVGDGARHGLRLRVLVGDRRGRVRPARAGAAAARARDHRHGRRRDRARQRADQRGRQRQHHHRRLVHLHVHPPDRHLEHHHQRRSAHPPGRQQLPASHPPLDHGRSYHVGFSRGPRPGGAGDGDMLELDGLWLAGGDIYIQGTFDTVAANNCTLDPGDLGSGSSAYAAAVDGAPWPRAGCTSRGR